MSDAPRSRAERVFLVLLTAFPPAFRVRYGRDALETFRDRLTAARRRGPVSAALLWVRTVPNVVVHGVLERLSEARRDHVAGAGAGTLRHAIRGVARAPGLSATIVTTLGVAVAANVAIFSVLQGVLIRPLPYPDADRLVRVWETNPEVDAQLHGPSPWNFADWDRAGVPGFESMAAWFVTSATLRAEQRVEELRVAQVTADFFPTLGVPPLHGRGFGPADVDGAGSVMLSHATWQRLFGGDPEVVGTSVPLAGGSSRIVGVMPPDFAFPSAGVEAWLAWDLPATYADRPEARTWRFLDGVARLAEGTAPSDAEERLDAVTAALAEAYPAENAGWGIEITSLHDDTVGDARGALWLAFGAVAFILLIACANVANLLLARAPAKRRELAVRTALGASRGRLLRETLSEYVLLGALSGAVGLGLGWALLELIVTLDAGRIPRLDEVSVNLGVLVFTAVVAAATSVAFGLAPTAHALRGSPRAMLRDGSRATTGGRGHGFLREVFVASQVALALVLLVGAGLLVTSLGRLTADDPGFEPAGVAAFRITLDGTGSSGMETARYYQGLRSRLLEVPGVQAVAATQALPLDPVGNDFRRPYRDTGADLKAADAPTVQMRIVTPGYVDAMGMTLLDGEDLPRDTEPGAPLVALVNRTLAERLRPGGRAVGETFEIDFRDGWQPYRIVGVVRDVKHYGARAERLPEVFLSHGQVPYVGMSVVARTEGRPEDMRAALLSAAVSHPPLQPGHDFRSLESLLADSTAEDRFLSALLSVLAGIALTLAGSGVYGVVAYTVSHQRREIGTRMALGADRGEVVRAVLFRAVTVCAAGLGLGLLVVLVFGGPVEGLLFGVSATDPRTLGGVSAILLAVSSLAAWLPARRAAWIAPSEALRET